MTDTTTSFERSTRLVRSMGKARHGRSPSVAVNDGISQRMLDETLERSEGFGEEFVSETCAQIPPRTLHTCGKGRAEAFPQVTYKTRGSSTLLEGGARTSSSG